MFQWEMDPQDAGELTPSGAVATFKPVRSGEVRIIASCEGIQDGDIITVRGETTITVA